MELRKIFKLLDWIYLLQDRHKLKTVVSTVMKFRVCKSVHHHIFK